MRCLFRPNTQLSFTDDDARHARPCTLTTPSWTSLSCCPFCPLVYSGILRVQETRQTVRYLARSTATVILRASNGTMSTRRKSMHSAAKEAPISSETRPSAENTTSECDNAVQEVRAQWMQERRRQLDNVFDTHDTLVRLSCHAFVHEISCVVDTRSISSGEVCIATHLRSKGSSPFITDRLATKAVASLLRLKIWHRCCMLVARGIQCVVSI
ncbi:hypothetical protein BC628DRAFT_1367939 [Trametes gibbosa]|nr:hypothetical protein BC628DRAFT_1367939 [Trametes gibbosa]